MVESASDEILTGAKEVDVAFLVVGDPFGYTYLPPNWQIGKLLYQNFF